MSTIHSTFRDLKFFLQAFFIIFVLSLLIFNGAAFFDWTEYKIHRLVRGVQEEIVRIPAFWVDSSGAETPSFLSSVFSGNWNIFNLSAEIAARATAMPEVPATAASVNILEMPQFEIQAPILEVATADSAAIYQALKQGVVLYPGSDVPGTGYSIIIGHSSQYPWSPGRYKSVFSLLNQLNPGDEIYVFWDQKPMVFEVRDKEIFLPWPQGGDSTETIFPPNDETTLILQSCWPVGVASKRVAVKTVLVR